MLTYTLKVYFVWPTCDFLPVLLLHFLTYCQHFVCENPTCYCFYLDVINLYSFSKSYFLYLEQRAIKFLQKIYKSHGHQEDQSYCYTPIKFIILYVNSCISYIPLKASMFFLSL
jgi:hypothetical protein